MLTLVKIAFHSLLSNAVSSQLSDLVSENARKTDSVFLKGTLHFVDKVSINPSVQKVHDWSEF